MSVQHACDGCGEPVEAPVEVGHVLKREYCADCALAASAFVEAEEVLRKDFHARFVDERGALIAKYSANGFRLPDVP